MTFLFHWSKLFTGNIDSKHNCFLSCKCIGRCHCKEWPCNTLKPDDAYIWWQTEPSLVLVMTFCLSGTKLIPKTILIYCQFDSQHRPAKLWHFDPHWFFRTWPVLYNWLFRSVGKLWWFITMLHVLVFHCHLPSINLGCIISRGFLQHKKSTHNPNPTNICLPLLFTQLSNRVVILHRAQLHHCHALCQIAKWLNNWTNIMVEQLPRELFWFPTGFL